MPVAPRLSRLRWLCRRGMKELDVLLESFINAHSEALEQGAFPDFEALLGSEDDQLWDWIQGTTTPQNRSFEELISLVRNVRTD